jgi:hypothetical protein
VRRASLRGGGVRVCARGPRSFTEGANRTPHDSRYTQGEPACEPAVSPIRPSRVFVSLLRVTHPAKDQSRKTLLTALQVLQEGVESGL